MATTGISLGTLSTSGGTSRLFGSASSIDTERLINALSDAKRIPADRLEAKIEVNERKAAAYAELRTRLTALSQAAGGLRNPPGVLGSRDNLFEAKEVSFSSSTATSPASILGVGVGSEVTPGRFDVTIESLATARKFMADGVSDARGALATTSAGGAGLAGSFEIGLADGQRSTIAVGGAMSLEDLRDAINGSSSTSGVTASVIRVGPADHRLVLSAARTGVEVSVADVAGGDVLSRLGLSLDGGASFKSPLSAASPARLRIDGIPIERASNQITDAVPGTTLNLFKGEPGTTVSVEVQRSLSGVRDGVQAFAEAYNAVRDMVVEHGRLDGDGGVAEDAVLFGDPTLRRLGQGLAQLVSRQLSGIAAGSPASLGSIGITLDPDNKLVVDAGKLETALLDDLDGVRDLLEFRFQSSSPALRVFDRSNELTDGSFQVVIQDANGDGVPETASADGVALEVRDGRLIGLPATPYAGLELLWAGRGDQTIEVRASQGVADRMFNLIDQALALVDGSLTRASDDLTARNAEYTAEIGKIDERVDRYRELLLAKFQAMETALSLANSMLEQVKAAFGSSNED